MCIAKQNLVFLEQNFLNCRGKGERVHTYAEGVYDYSTYAGMEFVTVDSTEGRGGTNELSTPHCHAGHK